MPRANITIDYVRRAKTGEHYDKKWRLPGSLSLRVSPRGVKSWCYLDAKRKRHSLGRWPIVSLEDAVAEAERLARRNSLGSPTVSDLAHDRLEALEATGASPSTVRTRRYVLERDILPALGESRTHDVSTADIQELIDERERKRQWAAAAAIHGTARWLFAGVVGRRQHHYDPSRSLVLAKRDRRRRTSCSLDTLVRVWKACELLRREEDGPEFQQLQTVAVQVQIACVQRSRQVLEMNREHISQWWNHPGEWDSDGRTFRTKNGKPQSIYITPLLGHMLELADPGDWLFALRGLPPTCYDWRVIQRLREKAGIDSKEWVPHDCRKVATTILDRDGVPVDHFQRLLSHSRPRSTATHFYVVPEPRDPVIRQTQERWESHLISALVDAGVSFPSSVLSSSPPPRAQTIHFHEN